MPYDDPDPQDPSILCGVELRVSRDDLVEMAYAFAEEYARLGHGPEEMLEMFRGGEYGGARLAWGALGESEIRTVVAECHQVYGRVRLGVVDVPELVGPAAPGRLPMIR